MSALIYIVEDDESIRELIRMALSSFSYETRAFETAEEALFGLSGGVPDLMVLDIMLPGMDGLELIRRLRADAKTRRLPIVLLTARDTEPDKVQGLDTGADDYIAKPFGVMELGARIRSLLRRAESASPPAKNRPLAVSDFVIRDEIREINHNGAPLALTFKEYELFRLLVELRDRIVSREELLRSVWGADFMGESRTLDMHIRALRSKLRDDAEHPKYIKTIRNIGYRFIG